MSPHAVGIQATTEQGASAQAGQDWPIVVISRPQ
jgi:hypothetical protein